MSLHIQLERFEGPLGLLLHLIRKEEMDIFDINIHQITRQYLEYIRAMKTLDLENAGDFVAMAATLIHIKSRTLLPSYNDEGEELEQEDPRKELVQKLLEYQKFQDVSKRLYERPLVGRDVFLRGERLEIEAEDDGEIIVEQENALFALIASYRSAVRNMKKTVHRVTSELQSISSRILEIKDRLVLGQKLRFRELITVQDNVSNQILVTFLSVLELAKMGFISVFQSEPFADIHLETKRAVDRDVIARVEDYEGHAPEDEDSDLSEEGPGLEIEALAGHDMTDEDAERMMESGMIDDDEEDGLPASAEIASDEEIEEEERRLAAQDNHQASHSEQEDEGSGTDQSNAVFEDGVS